MQDTENEYLSVENINGGRLASHINEHIKDVMEDVINPNKPAKARRELTIKIGFVPSKSRREAEIDYTVSAKLAGMEKEKSHCNVRKIGGKAFASVEHIEQQDLTFDSDADSAN